MNTPEEFRLFARECIAASLGAKTEAKRDALLKLARTWTAEAVELEAGLPVPGDSPVGLQKGNGLDPGHSTG
jgi:hypothetical protein